MKRTLLSLLLLFTSQGFVHAQSPLDDEGYQFALSSGYNIYGIPVYLEYEFGFTEDITIGLEGCYRTYSESSDDMTYHHNIAGLAFFSNYYFNSLLSIEDKYGLYAGLGIGFYKWFSPDNYFETGRSSSTLSIGLQIGGRYYFKNWGVLMEIKAASENAGVKAGICYRLDY